MKKLQDYLYYLYLAAMLGMSIFLFVKHVNAEAGCIRKIQVSEKKSGVVRLASGRNTTISFLSRPEKVVPGSPDAVIVNFIGKDLNIRPVGSHPGNLTVYTKSERIVLLLQMGNESNYDDVVEIVPFNQRRGMNLVKDTYK
jgi:hypothetical protein